jgi:hypothetical protein
MPLQTPETGWPSRVRHRCCMAVVSPCCEVLGSIPERAQPSSPVASLGAQWGSQARPPPSTPEAWLGWRKVGMTSSRHGPYALGDTRATVGGTEGCQPARGSESQKAARGSDRGLQPAPVKPAPLVTAGQHYRGEYVPGPCTPGPPRPGKDSTPKWVDQPPARRGIPTGAKAQQGSRSGSCG